MFKVKQHVIKPNVNGVQAVFEWLNQSLTTQTICYLFFSNVSNDSYIMFISKKSKYVYFIILFLFFIILLEAGMFKEKWFMIQHAGEFYLFFAGESKGPHLLTQWCHAEQWPDIWWNRWGLYTR